MAEAPGAVAFVGEALADPGEDVIGEEDEAFFVLLAFGGLLEGENGIADSGE
jgi:hypothetical protein